VSREYSGRVKIILRSWRTANNITEEKEKDPEAEEDETRQRLSATFFSRPPK
jgi:hypothetical protein